MRIALVVGGYFGKTGVATHVQDLTLNLSNKGINAVVFAPDVSASDGGVNPKFVRVLDWLLIPQPLTIFWQLIYEHKQSPISVVHVHDSVAFLGVYPFARLFNVPTVFTVQASIFSPGRHRDYPRHIVWVFKFTNRLVARKADALICGSKEMVSCTKYAGATDERIISLFNPIESRFFRNNECSNDFDRNNKKCLFVGGLRPNKGAEYLIRAIPTVLDICPEARFIILGDGPLKPNMVDLCKQLGVSKQVQFEGQVPYSILHTYYQQSYLFVFPSLNEPMGLALMQALASGLPIVGSRVGGIPELVKNNHNGILVEPGNSEALAKAMISILKDNELRTTMSQKAVTTVNKLSWEKNINRFIELYSTLDIGK